MLRVGDCKPGVEVIAIKQCSHILSTKGKPALSIGKIYTIRKLNRVCFHLNEVHNINNIILEELNIVSITPGCFWAYTLDCFKLRNKDELIELFDLNNIPLSLRNEELESI